MLQRVRQSIRTALPDGEERVRYGMPAVMLNERYAIHYAGWKKHLGLYPVPVLPDSLEAKIAPYRTHKDSLRFPYSKPIPYELIEELAAALGEARRVAEPPPIS
ncbi:MAG: DUF1801 domain-containing protein [Solirubrobacterales bacterium]